MKVILCISSTCEISSCMTIQVGKEPGTFAKNCCRCVLITKEEFSLTSRLPKLNKIEAQSPNLI